MNIDKIKSCVMDDQMTLIWQKLDKNIKHW